MRSFMLVGLVAAVGTPVSAAVFLIPTTGNSYLGSTSASGATRTGVDPARTLMTVLNQQPTFSVTDATSGTGGTSGGLDDPTPPAGSPRSSPD